MEVHRDDMINSGDGKEVCEHASGNSAAVALLLGLARVGKVPRLRQHPLFWGQTRRAAYGMTAWKSLAKILSAFV